MNISYTFHVSRMQNNRTIAENPKDQIKKNKIKIKKTHNRRQKKKKKKCTQILHFYLQSENLRGRKKRAYDLLWIRCRTKPGRRRWCFIVENWCLSFINAPMKKKTRLTIKRARPPKPLTPRQNDDVCFKPDFFISIILY